jgi:hypothetical protein
MLRLRKVQGAYRASIKPFRQGAAATPTWSRFARPVSVTERLSPAARPACHDAACVSGLAREKAREPPGGAL